MFVTIWIDVCFSVYDDAYMQETEGVYLLTFPPCFCQLFLCKFNTQWMPWKKKKKKKKKCCVRCAWWNAPNDLLVPVSLVTFLCIRWQGARLLTCVEQEAVHCRDTIPPSPTPTPTREMFKGLPYYGKLTLVIVKVFEINVTYSNAKWKKNYFPTKDINMKEVLKIQNVEINASYKKTTEFVQTTGTNLF